MADSLPARMPSWRSSPLALALALFGCGAAATQPKATAASGGSSLSNPIVRCGPEESYRFLAEELTCPDGKNPFAGDLELARQARRGSEPHPENDHIVDIYRVPCSGSDQHVFVDMYGCPAYERRLAESSPSPGLTKLVARYEAGDFGGVAKHCAQADANMPSDEASECMTLLPAALVLLGKAEAGIVFLGGLCSGMPEPSSLSDVRAHIVIRTVAFVDHARDQSAEPLGNEEGSRLLGAFAMACELQGEDIERYVRKHETL